MAKGGHSFIIKYDLNGRTCYHSETDCLSESGAMRFDNRKDAERVAASLAVKGNRKVTIVKVGLRGR